MNSVSFQVISKEATRNHNAIRNETGHCLTSRTRGSQYKLPTHFGGDYRGSRPIFSSAEGYVRDMGRRPLCLAARFRAQGLSWGFRPLQGFRRNPSCKPSHAKPSHASQGISKKEPDLWESPYDEEERRWSIGSCGDRYYCR